jgi:hypothetical protein
MDSRSLDKQRCGVCGAVLSQYNLGEFCYPCQESGKPYLSTRTKLSDIEELYLPPSTKLSDIAKLARELFSEKDALQRR